MGAQNSQISDQGIKNLNRSEMITIQLKKRKWYLSYKFNVTSRFSSIQI